MTRPGPTAWGALTAAVVVFAVALLAVAAPAGGTRTVADEPQYLLSALSLWEDRDLDIRDELREARYTSFHEGLLPQQTKLLPDGRRVSPHDPLLPVLLAVPMGVGGWLGAKIAMAAMAGGLAALLVLTASRRFGVHPGVGAAVVIGFGVCPPVSAYATQVYPEVPAALLVTAGIAAVTARLDGAAGIRWHALALASIVALPWLSVKYAPVAAVLALVLVVRLARSRSRGAVIASVAILVFGAATFVLAHRLIYGGFTAYASGDHFVGGELTVAGTDPDYAARAGRLMALLVDRWFGLAAWAPIYLLVVPAVAALCRRRPPGWAALVGVLGAGWLNATFVAFTMHGWWWPGRQVVVVIPAAVLAVAWAADHVWRSRTAVGVGGALVALGLGSWLWLLDEVRRDRLAVVTGFEQTGNPWLSVWQRLLPDARVLDGSDQVLMALWVVVFLGLAILGWRSGRMPGPAAGTVAPPRDSLLSSPN